jgi:hypothetical protein
MGLDCPLFFLPERSIAPPGLAHLLRWIHRGATPARARARRAASVLGVAASATACVLLAIGLLGPPGATPWPQVRPQPDVTALLHDLQHRSTGYGVLLGVPRAFAGAASAEPAVARAQAVLTDFVRVERLRAALDSTLRRTVSNAETLDVASRGARADTLDRAVRLHLAMHAAYLRQRPDPGTRSCAYERWEDDLARALVMRELLRVMPVRSGFGGWAPDSADDAWTRAWLTTIGHEHVGTLLDQWWACRPATEFYARYVAYEASPDSALRAMFAPLAPAVPRVHARDALAPAIALEGVRARLACRQQVSLLLAGPLARFVVEDADTRTTLARAATEGAARLMVIEFSRPGDAHWHLDARIPTFGVVPLMPGPDGRCTATVPHARPGMNLVLYVNRDTPDHVSTGDGLCSPVSGCVLTLDAPEGEIPFAGGAFPVLYRVVSGWTTHAVQEDVP